MGKSSTPVQDWLSPGPIFQACRLRRQLAAVMAAVSAAVGAHSDMVSSDGSAHPGHALAGVLPCKPRRVRWDRAVSDPVAISLCRSGDARLGTDDELLTNCQGPKNGPEPCQAPAHSCQVA